GLKTLVLDCKRLVRMWSFRFRCTGGGAFAAVITKAKRYPTGWQRGSGCLAVRVGYAASAILRSKLPKRPSSARKMSAEHFVLDLGCDCAAKSSYWWMTC